MLKYKMKEYVKDYEKDLRMGKRGITYDKWIKNFVKRKLK